jgi:hypothetical protein
MTGESDRGAPLHTLFEGGTFFEGPRWHDGRWWVSDFYTHRVLAIDETGNAETIMTVAGQPSGLGWLPDGSLLVVSMKDHLILRRSPDGEVSVHADIGSFCGGHANDMVVANLSASRPVDHHHHPGRNHHPRNTTTNPPTRRGLSQRTRTSDGGCSRCRDDRQSATGAAAAAVVVVVEEEVLGEEGAAGCC